MKSKINLIGAVMLSLMLFAPAGGTAQTFSEEAPVGTCRYKKKDNCHYTWGKMNYNHRNSYWESASPSIL